jgi:hypothetical protein
MGAIEGRRMIGPTIAFSTAWIRGEQASVLALDGPHEITDRIDVIGDDI